MREETGVAAFRRIRRLVCNSNAFRRRPSRGVTPEQIPQSQLDYSKRETLRTPKTRLEGRADGAGRSRDRAIRLRCPRPARRAAYGPVVSRRRGSIDRRPFDLADRVTRDVVMADQVLMILMTTASSQNTALGMRRNVSCPSAGRRASVFLYQPSPNWRFSTLPRRSGQPSGSRL